MTKVLLSLLAGSYLFSAHAHALIVADGTYEFQRDTQTTTGISFEKGENVKIQFRDDGSARLKMNLDPAEEGALDENLTLNTQEVLQYDLRLVQLGKENLEKPLRKRSRMHYMGATGCVAYVLKAIGWRGGRSGDGWEVTRTLRKMGWHSASCSRPSYGTVASWTGGHAGSGHTAIWQGCWAYDLACADPGHLYHMTDCVHR